MSGNTSNCSSYFRGREQDGVIKALVVEWLNTDGEFTADLHFLDLESHEVFSFFSARPPDAPFCFTVIVCGNHVYAPGGQRKNDDAYRGYEDSNEVFPIRFEAP